VQYPHPDDGGCGDRQRDAAEIDESRCTSTSRVDAHMSGYKVRDMVRGSGGALVLSLAIGLSLCPARALAAVGNREATRSYLEANLALAHAQAAAYAADVTALNELAKRVGAECPGVAAHAPHEGHELEELEVETATATIMVQFAPIRQQLVHFVHVGRSLRWSNGKLTALVHRIVSTYDELLLAPPNLCADWKGWIASGYAKLTPGSRRFLDAIPVITAGYGEGEGESSTEKISHLLSPYENREDRKLEGAIRRSERGETPAQMEAIGHATESVLVTLGLQKHES
jgi:hypothetical protein